MNARGFVYLVGAGPGDPKLLTLRALEVLNAVDVVAYDELISAAILQCIPPQTELLAVGRRYGCGKLPYRLHPDVLERARNGAVIARLKSGDPFLFGRGAEELQELNDAAIPFEVIPGISAAFGVAAYAGIPLTHRQYASRVTFLTGHRAEAASDGETIVLFMAAHKLRENLDRLIASGRSPHTPAAYVASATTPEQRVVIGTIGDLSDRLGDIDRTAPATIIVGEVVNLRHQMALQSKYPRVCGIHV